ncbi:uncharacterized protein TNCV_5031411 [Trichonephila clavipes]|nr:uncharacterized protein TNCV_5031411 [Trichonephila clavipes]
MSPHTITPAVGVGCRCKAKGGLKHSQRGLHTPTRLSSPLRLNLDSSLKTIWFHSTAVQFSRARHQSKRRRRWVGIKSSTRNGAAISNVLQPGAFVWFEKGTGDPCEGATCAWMAADLAAGCTHAFLTMYRSS